jgi:hypothetical protein
MNGRDCSCQSSMQILRRTASLGIKSTDGETCVLLYQAKVPQTGPGHVEPDARSSDSSRAEQLSSHRMLPPECQPGPLDPSLPAGLGGHSGCPSRRWRGTEPKRTPGPASRTRCNDTTERATLAGRCFWSPAMDIPARFERADATAHGIGRDGVSGARPIERGTPRSKGPLNENPCCIGQCTHDWRQRARSVLGLQDIRPAPGLTSGHPGCECLEIGTRHVSTRAWT